VTGKRLRIAPGAITGVPPAHDSATTLDDFSTPRPRPTGPFGEGPPPPSLAGGVHDPGPYDPLSCGPRGIPHGNGPGLTGVRELDDPRQHMSDDDDRDDDDYPDDDVNVTEPLAKRSFSAARRRELARRGHALPDGSYPIEDTTDLHNAAILARSGHGNVSAARRLIARRARELNVPDPLAAAGSAKAIIADPMPHIAMPAVAGHPPPGTRLSPNGMRRGPGAPDTPAHGHVLTSLLHGQHEGMAFNFQERVMPPVHGPVLRTVESLPSGSSLADPGQVQPAIIDHARAASRGDNVPIPQGMHGAARRPYDRAPSAAAPQRPYQAPGADLTTRGPAACQ
jgi:hypothetical protein